MNAFDHFNLIPKHVPAVCAAALLSASSFASAATPNDGAMTNYVSGRMPISRPSKEISELRPAGLAPTESSMTPAREPANTWSKLANLPGAVVHDVAFVSPTVGYAAAEEGQVWKTSDGGNTWTLVLNRGYPYYYYGVAVTGNKVVASGFNDSNSNGILTQSNDGGKIWAADTVLSTSAWADRVRFTRGFGHGLAMTGELDSGTEPNLAWSTTKPNDWQSNVPDPNGGWFGDEFTLLANKSAYASGITFCKSADTGATWSCAPPADSVFDGPTEFVNNKHGWTGGGEISPDVAGWLHRTIDGGTKWSGRVLQTPYPIREVKFLSDKIGWATGGNVYSSVGGMYYTADGGKTWALDANTGDEMGSCTTEPVNGGAQTQVWCLGFNFNGSEFSTDVYSTVVTTP
jgi:photosystem II stability/assembly factor-like uncharacterized protein